MVHARIARITKGLIPLEKFVDQIAAPLPKFLKLMAPAQNVLLTIDQILMEVNVYKTPVFQERFCRRQVIVKIVLIILTQILTD